MFASEFIQLEFLFVIFFSTHEGSPADILVQWLSFVLKNLSLLWLNFVLIQQAIVKYLACICLNKEKLVIFMILQVRPEHFFETTVTKTELFIFFSRMRKQAPKIWELISFILTVPANIVFLWLMKALWKSGYGFLNRIIERKRMFWQFQLKFLNIFIKKVNYYLNIQHNFLH